MRIFNTGGDNKIRATIITLQFGQRLVQGFSQTGKRGVTRTKLFISIKTSRQYAR